jgi:hypothetical protein
MKKISTLFVKDPNNLGRVINEVNPENAWVFTEDVLVTRKFDGTSVAIIDGLLFKRFDVKKGKVVPVNAIPCQEADNITGHHPHWLLCNRMKPEDKYFFEGFDNLDSKTNGTYELCGPKIQGNPEKFDTHVLVKHGIQLVAITSLSFEDLKDFLSDDQNDIEGFVFHNKVDNRMCKLRKSDFGIKRNNN